MRNEEMSLIFLRPQLSSAIGVLDQRPEAEIMVRGVSVVTTIGVLLIAS